VSQRVLIETDYDNIFHDPIRSNASGRFWYPAHHHIIEKRLLAGTLMKPLHRNPQRLGLGLLQTSLAVPESHQMGQPMTLPASLWIARAQNRIVDCTACR